MNEDPNKSSDHMGHTQLILLSLNVGCEDLPRFSGPSRNQTIDFLVQRVWMNFN